MAKRLSEFLTENLNAESTFTASQFPKLLAAISGSQNQSSYLRYLDRTLEIMNQYAGQPIPNPEFQALKDNFNRLIEFVFSGGQFLQWFRDANQAAYQNNTPRPEWHMSDAVNLPTYPHEVPGKLAKWKKALVKYNSFVNAKAYFSYYIALAEEIAPLLTRYEALKGRAFKKQPKAPEDKQAKYVAPMLEMEAGRIVMKVLTDLTNELKDRYATGLFERWIKEAEYWNGLSKEEQRKQYMFKSTVGTMHQIWQTVDEHGNATPYAHGPERLTPTWQTSLRAEAKKAANETQEAFIYKNAQKLGMILKNKGVALDGEPKVLHLKVSGLGFEGEIAFKFVDGSRFTVRNKTVWKMNQFRTEFTQYPTTFHNVIMPDGKPMGMPSEERMNRVFCNKPDAGWHV